MSERVRTEMKLREAAPTHPLTDLAKIGSSQPVDEDLARRVADGLTMDLSSFVEAAKKRYWDREAKVRTLA